MIYLMDEALLREFVLTFIAVECMKDSKLVSTGDGEAGIEWLGALIKCAFILLLR